MSFLVRLRCGKLPAGRPTAAGEGFTVRLDPMVALLVLVFIVMPILELAFFLQVANLVGFLPTLALVVIVSASGGWLVKREGLGALRRAQTQLAEGAVPAAELVNGGLIMFAGALMLAPGFLTDLLGLVLLVPPTRAIVRAILLRRFEKRIRAAFVPAGVGGLFGPSFADAGAAGLGDLGGLGDRGPRVRTGRATYGDVYDVHEVDDRNLVDRVDDVDGVDGVDRSERGRP